MEQAKQLEVVKRQELQIVNFEEYAMDANAVVRQVAMIQDVMKNIMHENEHYGVIPGTNKPTLLKPGAEKISLTFRFGTFYEINRSDMDNNHREYEIICTLKHIPTGQVVCQGLGSCSTMESKYRYRNAEQKCPSCGKNTIIKGKQQYGGGWLCFKKKGGCGEKFQDGDSAIENQDMGKIEHPDPADYYNTVLKMAKKRAHVDAVLTATAASDIFTQDVEDMPREALNSTPPEEKEDPKPLVADELRQVLTALMTAGGLNPSEIKDFFEWLDIKNVAQAREAIKDFAKLKTQWEKAPFGTGIDEATREQKVKIRAMLGDVDGFSSTDKDECYEWMFKTVGGGKTKEGASHIIEKFVQLKDSFIDSQLAKTDEPPPVDEDKIPY